MEREVSFEADPGSAGGWNAPSFAPWLSDAIERASRAVFGHAAMHAGCGGTIPFMGMLGRQFPKTQFLITGVLGPHSKRTGRMSFWTWSTPRSSPPVWHWCSRNMGMRSRSRKFDRSHSLIGLTAILAEGSYSYSGNCAGVRTRGVC